MVVPKEEAGQSKNLGVSAYERIIDAHRRQDGLQRGSRRVPLGHAAISDGIEDVLLADSKSAGKQTNAITTRFLRATGLDITDGTNAQFTKISKFLLGQTSTYATLSYQRTYLISFRLNHDTITLPVKSAATRERLMKI
jgi:hypothetical protein